MVVAFGGLDRTIVVGATDRVAELVGHHQIEQAWDRESRCEAMTVGGLVRHLVHQPQRVVEVLSAGSGTSSGPPIGLVEYYRQAPWANTDLDDPSNVAIRDDANTEAADGYRSAVEDLATARDGLAEAVANAGPVALLRRRQSSVLTTDDFLVTRLLEMVVHSDDLAVSVGLPSPVFGSDVIDPVLRLLAALSVHRHGEAALIRVLTRPQRASRDVTAF